MTTVVEKCSPYEQNTSLADCMSSASTSWGAELFSFQAFTSGLLDIVFDPKTEIPLSHVLGRFHHVSERSLTHLSDSLGSEFATAVRK